MSKLREIHACRFPCENPQNPGEYNSRLGSGLRSNPASLDGQNLNRYTSAHSQTSGCPPHLDVCLCFLRRCGTGIWSRRTALRISFAKQLFRVRQFLRRVGVEETQPLRVVEI